MADDTRRGPSSRKGNGVGKGPGKGDGWGGPAKGASTAPTSEERRFKPGNPGNPELVATHAPAEREAYKAWIEEKNRRMLSIIVDLAETAERQETRLTAATHFRRTTGADAPVKSVTYDGGDFSNLSDADLDAELARTRIAIAEAEAKTASEAKPGGMVH